MGNGGGFRNPVFALHDLIRQFIQSPNFQTGVSGWILRRDGSAEFNDVVINNPIINGLIDIQTFLFIGPGVPQLWTKPANAEWVRVWVIGGGGGGGSGRRGAAGTIRSGGGGGQGSGISEFSFPATALAATETVEVGGGGAGGAAIAVDDTNGNPGLIGGNSFFGVVQPLVTRMGCAAGLFGAGGTATGAAGGGSLSVGANGRWRGGPGGAASAVGGVGGDTVNHDGSSNGGAGGGGITSGNVPNAGGTVFGNPGRSATTIPGGAINTDGGDGFNYGILDPNIGWSGSGGGASIVGAAGRGGDAFVYGGGGGGGGASLNGNNSGRGGNGSNGIVIATTWCA